MKINISNNEYELNNDEFNNIFEESKIVAGNVINSCENKDMNHKQLLYYITSVNCHFNHLVQSMIEKLGEEEFIKTLGAVKVENEK